ncbi:MAG: 50S ribosomal protein L11 [Candidatus Marsarchaeota archaeon]|jgi:large subunit ribosomal protein L11
MAKKVFKFRVDAGKATPGPPIGQALGPTGVKTPQVVAKINELTKKYMGMKVPVKVTVDMSSKDFEVEVGQPSLSSVLLHEIGKSGGVGKPGVAGEATAGDISLETIVKVTEDRADSLTASTFKGAVRTVLGVAASVGLTVNGKKPKEVISEINSGAYDQLLSKGEIEFEAKRAKWRCLYLR